MKRSLACAAVLVSLASRSWGGASPVRTVPNFKTGIVPLGAAAFQAGTQWSRLSVTGIPAGPILAAPSLPSLSLAAPSLPSLPVQAAAAVPVLEPVLPAAAPETPAEAASLKESLALSAAQIEAARSGDATGEAVLSRLDALYGGSRSKKGSVDAAGGVVNDEGMVLLGRAADYYRRSMRIVEKYKGRLDLGESLDVMSDSYGDVWAKIKGIEALGRGSSQNNTHLEETLTWVDGVMTDHGRRTAIHTHRVFFHHAKNPRSEIAEGIRRVDRYLKETLLQFASGGKAEAELGRFQEVRLIFDTRGYSEIKDFLKGREAQLHKAGLTRYRFSFLDELTPMPADEAAMRAELNEMTKRYKDHELQKIIEGVTYGRYVGLLLELATVDHYMSRGWNIILSGRDFFDRDGMYVTELDVVARSPEGRVALVEAKSARVPLPFPEVLKDKVLAKLETYAKHRALLEESIGHPIDEVVFSFDVGSNRALGAFLQKKEAELSKKYGFTVRFLFLKMEEAGQEETAPRSRR